MVRITHEGDDIVSSSDLVVLGPLVVSFDNAGAELLDVVIVVDLGAVRIADIDGHNHPVCVTAVFRCNRSKHFPFTGLTEKARILSDVEDVGWIYPHCTVAKRVALMWPRTSYKPGRIIAVVVQDWRRRLLGLDISLAISLARYINDIVHDALESF